jgi:hypothetical protein
VIFVIFLAPLRLELDKVCSPCFLTLFYYQILSTLVHFIFCAFGIFTGFPMVATLLESRARDKYLFLISTSLRLETSSAAALHFQFIMSIKVNDVVLVREETHLWLPATVVKARGDCATVRYLTPSQPRDRPAKVVSVAKDLARFALSPLEVENLTLADDDLRGSMAKAAAIATSLPVVQLVRYEEVGNDQHVVEASGRGQHEVRPKRDSVSLDEIDVDEDLNGQRGSDFPQENDDAMLAQAYNLKSLVVPIEALTEDQLGGLKVRRAKRVSSKLVKSDAAHEKNRNGSAPSMTTLSDYEKLRQKNIEERQVMFAKLRADLQEAFGSQSTSKGRGNRHAGQGRQQSRYTPYVAKRDPYQTRARGNPKMADADVKKASLPFEAAAAMATTTLMKKLRPTLRVPETRT